MVTFLDITLYEMGVKIIFFNGYLEEDMYATQPPSFENPEMLDHVYKLDKGLYGLKQSSRYWFERLSKFLLENGVTKILFTLIEGKHILVVQVYVDDFIFESTNKSLCDNFFLLMQSEFKMSMIGELSFFLGLQIKQASKGTMIQQLKHLKELIKKYGMDESKAYDTPMSSTMKMNLGEKGMKVNETTYQGIICSLLYLIASRLGIMFILS